MSAQKLKRPEPVPHVREIRPLWVPQYQSKAISEGAKIEMRVPVQPSNSEVGGVNAAEGFEGIDLESGRGTPGGEIRVRRTFENGQVRVVSIISQVQAMDLFWLKRIQKSTREESKLTLEVISVRGIRIRDMSVKDAFHEGVWHFPFRYVSGNDPRETYAGMWDTTVARKNRELLFQSNPWVWVYRFHAHAYNVDSRALARKLRAAR